MQSIRVLALILIFSRAALSEKVTYKGYKLVRIIPQTDEHINLLNELENKSDVCYDDIN